MSNRFREVTRQSDWRENPIRLQAPCSRFQPSHIGAAGSQAARASRTSPTRNLGAFRSQSTFVFVRLT